MKLYQLFALYGLMIASDERRGRVLAWFGSWITNTVYIRGQLRQARLREPLD